VTNYQTNSERSVPLYSTDVSENFISL